MTAPFRVPPDPVGQQGPPARAAASNVGPLRSARGSLLLTTGTGCSRNTSDDKVLRQDPHAWQQGYDAGYLGESVCPYAANACQSWAWSSGYLEGKAAKIAKPKSSP
jgi:ribosome modulation factor